MSVYNAIRVPVTTTGSAGSATGSGTVSGVNGFLHSIHVDYNGSAPATTDVTFSDTTRTFLTLTDANTDAHFIVRKASSDTTGSAGSAELPFMLVGADITIAVAGADALAPCVTVTLFVYGGD